jgi:sulfite exporter TauE/SafE
LEPTFLVALLLGLSSAPHCIGMCGAISGALSMSLPREVRERRGQLLLFNLAFSLGRVGSYAVAGALAGLLGSVLAERLAPLAGLPLLRLVPVLLVVLAGLYVGGWVPRLALVERVGIPLWQRLEPLGRRLIPVRSLSHSLLYGLVWGWLPCGLVYWALLIAAAAGDPAGGAGFMVIFGIATLPGMVATGMLAGWIQQIRRLPHANRVAGLMLIILGLVGVFYIFEIEQLIRAAQ